MKSNKVTFKKRPRATGLMAVGYPNQSVDIKLDSKVIGCINAPNWQTVDHKWGVSFMVFSNEENVNWKWITLIARFDEEELARQWVLLHISSILKRYRVREETKL